MGQSATILVVINSNFPSDQKSIRYEYRDRMDVLESKYDMSIVDLRNDEDSKKMADIVIDYFLG